MVWAEIKHHGEVLGREYNFCSFCGVYRFTEFQLPLFMLKGDFDQLSLILECSGFDCQYLQSKYFLIL